MIVDFNEKDFKLMKKGIERLYKDATDLNYLKKLTEYLDDCIEQMQPLEFSDNEESFEDNRLTVWERNK